MEALLGSVCGATITIPGGAGTTPLYDNRTTFLNVLGAPASILESEFPHNPTVWDSGLFVF